MDRKLQTDIQRTLYALPIFCILPKIIAGLALVSQHIYVESFPYIILYPLTTFQYPAFITCQKHLCFQVSVETPNDVINLRIFLQLASPINEVLSCPYFTLHFGTQTINCRLVNCRVLFKLTKFQSRKFSLLFFKKINVIQGINLLRYLSGSYLHLAYLLANEVN